MGPRTDWTVEERLCLLRNCLPRVAGLPEAGSAREAFERDMAALRALLVGLRERRN